MRDKGTYIRTFSILTIYAVLMMPVAFAFEMDKLSESANTIHRRPPSNQYLQRGYSFDNAVLQIPDAGVPPLSQATRTSPMLSGGVGGSGYPTSWDNASTYNESVKYFAGSLAYFQDSLYTLFELVKGMEDAINASAVLNSVYLPDELNDSRGVVVTEFEGEDFLYVVDYYGRNLSGNYLGGITRLNTYGIEYDYLEFNTSVNPQGITAKDKSIYLISGDRKVMELSKKLSHQPRTYFDIPPEITDPVGIAYDTDRDVFWILDVSLNRIFKVAINGSIAGNISIGSADNITGYLDYQKNHIYYAGRDTVKIIDTNGILQETLNLTELFLDTYNLSGTKFRGISVQGNSNFYVMDDSNEMIHEIGYPTIPEIMEFLAETDITDLSDAADQVRQRYSLLSGLLYDLSTFLDDLSVPAAGQEKYDQAKTRFLAARTNLTTSISRLLSNITSLETLLDEGIADPTVDRRELYMQLISELRDTKSELRATVDVIYDETSIKGAARPDLGVLSHRLLALNYTQTPTVAANITSSAPSAQDLVETLDVKFTQEIINKSNSLTIPQLYGWAKEAISYEPYYGSLKGTEITMRPHDSVNSDVIVITKFPKTEYNTTYIINNQTNYSFTYTQKQRSGNDIDQASVLVSLLRANGVYARYVHGTVEAPKEDVALWLNTGDSGVMQTFRDNGIPAEINGNTIRFEHWWVTAHIGGSWVDLDPSWDYDPGIPIINESYIEYHTDINCSSEDLNLSPSLVFDLGNMTRYSFNIFTETKKYEDLSLLNYTTIPASLDYTVVSRFAEYSELPVEERHYVDVEILGGGERLINYTCPSFELASNLVSIRFNLTSESNQIFTQMGEAVPFLLNYTPSLYLDETVVGTTVNSKIEGEAYTLRLAVRTPRFNRTINTTLVSSSDTSIVFDVDGITESFFDDQVDLVNQSIDSNTTSNATKMARSLNLMGLFHFHLIDKSYEGSSITNLINFWKPSTDIAVVSEGSEIIFGVPLLSTDSVQINSVEDIGSVNSRKEQFIPEASHAYFNLAGSFNNAFIESMVLATLGEGEEGITTVSALILNLMANQQGIASYAMTESTYNYMLDQMLIPTKISDNIRKSMVEGNGMMVISKPLIINNQPHYGLMIVDGKMGASYMLISQNRYSYGVISTLVKLLERIKKSIESIMVLSAWSVLEKIWGVIDFFISCATLLSELKDLAPWSTRVINYLSVFSSTVGKYLSRISDALGPLGTFFDIVDLIKYLYYCLVDIGSATCILGFAALKFGGTIIAALGIGLSGPTLGLSAAAAAVLKYVLEQIAEAVLAGVCNPGFIRSGKSRVYKAYTGSRDGPKEGPDDREFYAGTIKDCYKEVTFGVDSGVISNTGLFPMIDVEYKVHPGNPIKNIKIPFLPGDNYGFTHVDWLDGTENEYFHYGKVEPPTPEGNEDVTAVEIRETTVFKLNAKDSGKCKIDFKVFGLIDVGLGNDAKLPVKPGYKGAEYEAEYSKVKCCRAVAQNSYDLDSCLNRIGIDSSDSSGVKLDAFSVKEDIYANVEWDVENITGGIIYVMRSEDLTPGCTLEDVSTTGPRIITMPTPGKDNKDSEAVLLWPANEDNPLGNYEIIFDRNRNGTYDLNDDVKDPNGFIIVKMVSDPDMFVDSEGTIHFVAIERLAREGDYLLYKAIPPSEPDYRIDLIHENLSEWSMQLRPSNFTEIRQGSRGSHLRSPKIAVDSEGNVHIVTMFHHLGGGYKWLLYDNITKETGETGCGTIMVGRDYDGWSFDMMNPTIAIDPTDDQPVVAVNLEVMFPEPWYILNVYLPMYIATMSYWYGMGVSVAATGQLVGAILGPELAICGTGACNLDFNTFLYTHYKDMILIAKPHEGGPTGGSALYERGWSFRYVDKNPRSFNRMTGGVSGSTSPTMIGYLSEFEYPSIAVDEDGAIHVTYIWGEYLQGGLVEPKVMYATEDGSEGWIKTEISDEDSIPLRYQRAEIALDSENNVHVVWEKEDDKDDDPTDGDFDIYYTDVDSGEIVKLGNASSMYGKPLISIDKGDNIHVVWLGESEVEGSDDVFYRMRNATSDPDEWSDELRLTRSEENEDVPWINYPMLDTNRRLEEDWANKVYLGWMESIEDERVIDYKRTMPHTTFLIVLDGVSDKALKEHLSEMTNLGELLGSDMVYMRADAETTFPETSFSTQASMLTGLQPKDHKVIGDSFRDDNGKKHVFFPPVSADDYGGYDDADEVNDYLGDERIDTIFDYVDEAGYSSAAIASIYNKGIGDKPTDEKIPIEVSWEEGKVCNFNEVMSYLEDVDARDSDPENDPADLISLYILGHDHGIEKEVDGIDYGAIDDDLGLVIDKLKEKYMYNDSIIIITSDHRMYDVKKDDEHSLNYPDRWVTEGPINEKDLFLNSRIAYYYTNGDFDNEIIPAARHFYNKSFIDFKSDLYGRVENILVRRYGIYNEYEYIQVHDVIVDILIPVIGDDRISNLECEKTPDIILFAEEGSCDDTDTDTTSTTTTSTTTTTTTSSTTTSMIISTTTTSTSTSTTTSSTSTSSTTTLPSGVYECSNCSSCNTYINSASAGDVIKLKRNVIHHIGSCINITTDNLTFNCQGHVISGNHSGITYGIYLSGVTGTVIENCIVTDFGYGIYINSSANTTVNDNEACHNNISDFFISDSPQSEGDGNACDIPGGWNDNGTTGCSYSCPSTTTTTSTSSSTSTVLETTTTSSSTTTSTTSTPTTSTSTTSTTSTSPTSTIDDGSSTDYAYFQEPHESIYGFCKENVPFIITGPGYKYFSPGSNTVSSASILDVGVTAAYFVGGQKLVESMSSLAGVNRFTSELTVEGHSPIHLHLYDSEGRHTGPRIDGTIETGIPSSSYTVYEWSGIREITLLDAPDDYKLVINAFNEGEFSVDIKSKRKGNKYRLHYPSIDIINHSLAVINRLGANSTDMKFDFEWDGIYERIYQPTSKIKVTEGENNATVLISALSGDELLIDTVKSTGTQVKAKASSNINDGMLTITRHLNDSLDRDGFYTLGEFVELSLDGNLAGKLSETSISVHYPVHKLGYIAEDSLSLYKWTSNWSETSYPVDTTSNKFTNIAEYGRFIVAGSDQVPVIHDISISPKRTKIPQDNVAVKANVSDNQGVDNVKVRLLNSTYDLPYIPASGLYETTLTAPQEDGTYYLTFYATDNENNTDHVDRTLIVDTCAPNITIVEPENGGIITHTTVDVKYLTGERTQNDSYSLDGQPRKQIMRGGTLTLVNVSHSNHILTVYATDFAGNNDSDTVGFEIPEHNVELSNLDVPAFTRINKSIVVTVDVRNTGNNTENITVELLQNGSLYETRSLTQQKYEISQVSFIWQGDGGFYDLGVNAMQVTGETYLDDNSLDASLLVTDKPVVLLVDDEVNSTSQQVYGDAISASGYDLILLDTEEGIVDQEYMRKFGIVVWFTGEGKNTLSDEEISSLETYLDGGGFLFLSGQGIGADIGSTDFYGSYLHAAFRGRSGITTVEGVIGDPIGYGFLFSLNDSGEKIRPSDIHASNILLYSDGEASAIKATYDNGDDVNKVVYLAFGFEDIGEEHIRNSIMDRTFTWFSIDVTPPRILEITPENGSGLQVNTTNVTLRIVTDEEAECRLSATQQVFAYMDLFDDTYGTTHSKFIGGLQNNTSYNYFISCVDDRENLRSTSTGFFVWNRTFLPPEFSVSDVTVYENETVIILVNATDPESDPLTYTLSDVLKINFPTPIAGKFTRINNTFRYTPGFDDSGTYNLRVTVGDGFVNVSRDFILTIVDVNRPPVLEQVGPKVIIEDVFFYCDVNATDPDGDELTFYDDTSLFDINPYMGTITFTPKNQHIGNYTVNISVSDGVFVDSELVNIRVGNTNDAPVLSFVTPQYATEEVQFTMNVTAYDPDGDPLIFWDNSALFNITSAGMISFTPSNADVGTYMIEVGVSDGQLNDTKILNLIVEDVNQDPVILSFPDVIYTFQLDHFELNVTACDPDTDPTCMP